MIKLRVGVPHIPFLDVLLLFNDGLGATLIHLDTKRYRTKARRWQPTTHLSHISCRFVYASRVADLPIVEQKIASSSAPYVVLVGGSAVDVHQHRIPVFPRMHLTREDVFYLNDTPAPADLLYEPLEKHVDLARDIYENLAQPSILQLIHTLFYRIADKTDRLRCQTLAYRYLSGALARPPVSGVNKLDGILKGSEALSLRASVIGSLGLSKEAQEDLDYDVRYVLAKVGQLSTE